MAGIIAEHSQPAFCLCLPVQRTIYQMAVPGFDRVLRVICGGLTKPLKHSTLVKTVTHIKSLSLQSTSTELIYLKRQGHVLRKVWWLKIMYHNESNLSWAGVNKELLKSSVAPRYCSNSKDNRPHFNWSRERVCSMWCSLYLLTMLVAKFQNTIKTLQSVSDMLHPSHAGLKRYVYTLTNVSIPTNSEACDFPLSKCNPIHPSLSNSIFLTLAHEWDRDFWEITSLEYSTLVEISRVGWLQNDWSLYFCSLDQKTLWLNDEFCKSYNLVQHTIFQDYNCP